MPGYRLATAPVVMLGEHSANQAGDSSPVGEYPNNIGPPLPFFIEPYFRVIGPVGRESRERVVGALVSASMAAAASKWPASWYTTRAC